MQLTKHLLETTSASVTIGPSRLVFRDRLLAQDLLTISDGWPLLPIIDGATVPVKLEKSEATGDGIDLTFMTIGAAKVSQVQLRIERAETADAFDLSCRFTAASDCTVEALAIAPAQTALNVYDVVNFRHGYCCPSMWPELPTGGKFSTSTYSDDWQFAPHPTALILRKNDSHLFVGFRGLMPSFGMKLDVERNHVRRWEVDFGGAEHGLRLKAGEEFSSAPLRLFCRKAAQPYSVFAEFGAMLVQCGEIADPQHKPATPWWRQPIYCTWGDQVGVVGCPTVVELQAQVGTTAITASVVLNEAFVRKAVAIIKRERLPIRTIILDEGWAKARGDWTPHPERFPHFRQLVDELHADGFKVMVWWNWAEVAKTAEIDPRQLAGNGWLNKHGCPWRDYSDPAVRENYLKPLMRKFFSNASDCYDLDGVKTDFLADKVYPATPVSDPSWRGEENYFHKITAYFHGEMRTHKPDAMHMGCSGHYWLAEHMETCRTFDVFSSNWREHEERARMIACTAPGVTVAYDVVASAENMLQWFDSARQLDASVQIGNVIALRPDTFAPPQTVGADYFELLRNKLK